MHFATRQNHFPLKRGATGKENQTRCERHKFSALFGKRSVDNKKLLLGVDNPLNLCIIELSIEHN